MNSKLKTYYAPPERASKEVIEKQAYIIKQLDIEKFLDAVPNVYCILNSNRQIIYANKALNDLLKLSDKNSVIGLRPGEALNCKNSIETLAGCGTAEACRKCGAVNAILTSQKGKPDIQECRLTDKDTQEPSDYRVWTYPITLDNEEFVIFAVTDISNEKRRQALERIFFHDVLNTAGVLQGFVSLINDYPEEFDEYKVFLKEISNHLIEEIKAQKDLISAENNELKVNLQEISSRELLNNISIAYQKSELGKDKIINIDETAQDINLISDRTLLNRIIGNMLKNALEASKENQTITLNAFKEHENIIFSVHNPNFIPRDIQLQIFQRSFSTKGTGRGLGTYSMKLLAERYLKGKVYFKTNEETGTTFFCAVPLIIEGQ